MAEFKKLSDVNVIESRKEGLNVLVEDNGEIVKLAADELAPNIIPDTSDAHKYLTTNSEGEKVWEEKLAYTVEEEIIFMAESTYEFSGSSISINVSDLELGTTYTVRCDNTEYQTTFLPWDETNNTFGTLGNRSLAGQGEDTGEPFYLSLNPALGFGSMHFKTAGSHTISVTGSTFTHHQVPQKYIAGIIEGTGENSVVMNYGTPEQATGIFSFAEGGGTKAVGNFSHAEGDDTIANGPYSHAEGVGTIASSHAQHVQGRYNIEDTDKKYLHIVGNGDYSSDGTELIRSNAHTLDREGNAWFAGTVKVGGTGQDDENAKDIILAPATASVGQTIVVKAVDATGKPTEWETAKMPQYVSFTKNGNNVFCMTSFDKAAQYARSPTMANANLSVSDPDTSGGIRKSINYYANGITVGVSTSTYATEWIQYEFILSDGSPFVFRYNSDGTLVVID